MKHKTYRLCLLSLIVLAVIGGVFYYLNTGRTEAKEVDGTFVEKMLDVQMNYAMTGGTSSYEWNM